MGNAKEREKDAKGRELKKVTPSRLSEIVERAPQDQPMALGEIVKEVKRYRRIRRARRR